MSKFGSKVFNNNRKLIIDIIDNNIILKFNFGKEHLEYKIRPGLINAYLDLERLLNDIINDNVEKPEIKLSCNAAEYEDITIRYYNDCNKYELDLSSDGVNNTDCDRIGVPITKDDTYTLIKSIIEITKNN